jgi:hypothetical protein
VIRWGGKEWVDRGGLRSGGVVDLAYPSRSESILFLAGLPAILPRPLNRVRVNPFRISNTSDPACDGQTNPWAEPPVAENGRDRAVSLRGRLSAAMMAAALLVPLVIACLLEPNARGHGTHQQLGFPPCTLVALCGIRCPTCGMTTSWAALVRGRLSEGLAANVGGVLLAVGAIGSVIGLSSIAILGRRPKWFPGTNGFAWGGIVIAAVTLVDWVIRILLLR